MSLEDLWSSLGFSGNPYQSTPLRPTDEDFQLFIGRERTGVEFRTLVEGSDGCVTVISGDVGVGKTSFFNIQQYLLFTGKGGFGPKLAPALELTTLEADSTPTSLARRITHNIVGSLEQFCEQQKLKCPSQIRKLKKWISSQKAASGFDVGLSVLGTGGNFSMSFDLPPVDDATLENWKDILRLLAGEVRDTLKFDGVFAVLDNAENVDNDHLTSLLMSFRDTLFIVPGVWWVIIGQSGLYSLIDASDKRISQRIQGTGLEIEPLTADELHEIIERRVQRFRSRSDAVSPISKNIHRRLYEASRGEIRFVLKMSDALIRKVITDVRTTALEIVGSSFSEIFHAKFLDLLAKRLVEGQITDERAKRSLKDLTYIAMRDLRLRKKEVAVLHAIGEGEARASDYARFRIKTMQDFSANYLTKLFRANLLHRRQHGRAVYYSLRGLAALAHEFKLFEKIMTETH